MARGRQTQFQGRFRAAMLMPRRTSSWMCGGGIKLLLGAGRVAQDPIFGKKNRTANQEAVSKKADSSTASWPRMGILRQVCNLLLK